MRGGGWGCPGAGLGAGVSISDFISFVWCESVHVNCYLTSGRLASVELESPLPAAEYWRWLLATTSRCWPRSILASPSCPPEPATSRHDLNRQHRVHAADRDERPWCMRKSMPGQHLVSGNRNHASGIMQRRYGTTFSGKSDCMQVVINELLLLFYFIYNAA